MKIQSAPGRRMQAGYALLLVMILLTVSLIVLGATMNRTSSTAMLTDRNNLYTAAGSAADAATEKALSLMMNDFQINGETRVTANLGRYATNIPTASENPFFGNFEFSDAQGHANQTFVQRHDTNANAAFVALQEQYAGLNGFSSTYRIISNVRALNSSYNYNFTNAVQQDVQLAEIPIFQFAIFYNGLMEYTWCAPLTVRGRVHANGDIYVGSSANLTFNYTVTTTGQILSPAWDGHTPGQYTGPVAYNGAPKPGYSTGVAALTLPIGTNNSAAAVREIVNPPPSGESVNSAMGSQRYYNKAGMLIIVSNNAVNVTLENGGGDPFPWVLPWTNANYFISTNATFYDQREGMTIKATQLDVGKFITWVGTNIPAITKFNGVNGNKLNILWVADYRTTNSTTLTGVRLVNGTTIPGNGLTVATPNPLYIVGNYNCPNPAYLGTTNTTASSPASVISDALTLLSANWSDALSGSGYGARPMPVATTVNAAIIAGVVYSTGSGATTYSGGVMNLPRLLENWNGITLTLNTSMVNLYNSVWAIHQFQNPGFYYNAPSRNFNFDMNFNDPSKLPPGTPGIRRIIRANWCNPGPDNTNYNFSLYTGQ
jgi:hypothetical protein